jgi:hypothetical protein
MLEIEIVLSLCLAHTLGYSASSNQALVIEITTFYVFSRSIVKIITFLYIQFYCLMQIVFCSDGVLTTNKLDHTI